MAGDCMFRPMVPFLEIGSVTGAKGELIKTMCEETRARIRVLDAPVATPDYIMCPNCAEDPPGDCSQTVSVMEEKRNPNGLCSFSGLKSAKESFLGTVYETCVPTLVYKRKNRQGRSENIVLDKTSKVMRKVGDCDSTICSNAPSIAERGAPGAAVVPSVGFNAQPTCANSQDHVPNEKPIDAPKIVDVDSVNDSCSSRSNAEPVSVPLMTRTEDTGECSSSSVFAREAHEDTPMSEKDICILILRREGLLWKAKSSASCSVEDGNNISTVNSYRDGSLNCRACCRSETARKMIICDSCDGAFHLSCCNSRRREFKDNDEWFCTSCLAQKHVLVGQTGSVMRLTRLGSEADRSILTPAEEKSSLISFMLRDSGPYQSNVRVGKGFQADVPNWTGPVKGDDMFGEPEELDTTYHIHSHVCSSSRPPKYSSICNWLQCKQVVDNGETICGKWRRAPLSEVQTDDWECFCCLSWDSSHADCAVPQELDTDEVLKQLKYIELLRSHLALKQQKLVRPKLNGLNSRKGPEKIKRK